MTSFFYDPFTVLGLPVSAELTDAQVRDAWRAIATTTHPDLPDGGDPARYSAASAAYAALRTPWARSEAYADLMDAAPSGPGHKTCSRPRQSRPPTCRLPILGDKLAGAPPRLLQQLCQAFDVQILYKKNTHQVSISISITITDSTPHAVAAIIAAAGIEPSTPAATGPDTSQSHFSDLAQAPM